MEHVAPPAHRYAWTRYWVDRDQSDPWNDNGYFPDPDSPSWIYSGVQAHRLEELTEDSCLVLLGEPGLGKSSAIDDARRELVSSAGDGEVVRFINLAAYPRASELRTKLVDHASWNEWLAGKTYHLFLDSLDEALLSAGEAHKLVVSELDEAPPDALARLRLRIACRMADWHDGYGADLASLGRQIEREWEPRYLALAPLRARDVAHAATAEGLDADDFLQAIASRDVEHIAATPLTLKMLIAAARDEAGLPDSRAQLYRRAALRLATEHDPARRNRGLLPALHPGARVAVAERIAAASLLAGRTTISCDPGSAVGHDVDPAEIAGYSEQDEASAGGSAFQVGIDQLLETLATALFVDAGPRRVGFLHRGFAEYLAASYLVRHGLDHDQLRSLLVAPQEPEGGRFIPELREVAAWAAVLGQDALTEVLRREPDLLVRADRLLLSDEQASQVVEALLTEEVAERMNRWDRRMWRNMRGLKWSGLASQLRKPIGDATVPIEVRQLAITLARACESTELEEDLLSLALDDQEPPYLRDDAVMALSAYGTAASKRRLIPLATTRIPDDDDDQVKGTALQATCPDLLSVEDALKSLTPPRNEHLVGSYSMFLGQELPDAIRPGDLPAALAWAAEVEPNGDPRDHFNDLVDVIVRKGLASAHDPEVARGVAAVARRRLRSHVDLVGRPLSSRDAVPRPDAETRRAVLLLLIDDISDDPKREDKLHPRRVQWSEPSLFTEDDLGWMLDRLESSVGRPVEAAWAAMIRTQIDASSPEIERAYDLMDVSPELRERIGSWFDAIDIDSELADLLRESTHGPPPVQDPPADAPDMDHEIEQAINTFESGEVQAWVRLNNCLLYGPRGQADKSWLEADLTALPGWERASEPTRTRIVAAAGAYLETSDADPAAHFGAKRVDLSAAAGYRALHLLARCDMPTFQALPSATWAHWAPTILHFPHPTGVNDGGLHGQILSQAIRKAPTDMADWIARRIDSEKADDQGRISVVWRLENVDEPPIVDVVLGKLSDADLSPRHLAELLQWCIVRARDRSLAAVSPRLTASAVEGSQLDHETAAEIAAVALTHAPAPAWKMAKPLLESDPEWARGVLKEVAHGEKADLAVGLSDEDLAALAWLVFRLFPPDEDPPLKQAGYVSPRESARWMRDRLIQVLASRGSDVAVETIERVVAERQSPGLRALLRDAQDARRSRRRAPEPGHVVELAQSNGAYLILSEAHLQSAIRASLRRIQRSLNASDLPAAVELWSKEPDRPKDEEEICDWLARRLRTEMASGARLIDREVQIAPNATGRGRGKSVDLQVSAATGSSVQEAEMATVYVEVKGIWNKTVKTDMKTQLVYRYLAPTGREYGVYVVLWFPLDAQDPAHQRRGPASGMTLDEAGRFFDSQAAQLSTETGHHLVAFVLDGTKP